MSFSLKLLKVGMPAQAEAPEPKKNNLSIFVICYSFAISFATSIGISFTTTGCSHAEVVSYNGNILMLVPYK